MTTKWQDRFVQCCTQDIRRALHYAVFYMMTTTSVVYSIYGNGQLRRRKSAAESQPTFARENFAYYTSADDFAPRFVAPRPRAQSVDTDRSRPIAKGESELTLRKLTQRSAKMSPSEVARQGNQEDSQGRDDRRLRYANVQKA